MKNTRALATAAAVMLIIVLGVGVLYAYRVQTPPTSASAAPTSTATLAVAPATASPLATSSPASGRYVSPFLGYSIETPPPWHRSSCSGVLTQQSATPGGEVFVSVSVREEGGTDIGSPYPTLTVMAEANPQTLSPRQWAEQLKSGVAGQRIENVTYAGRPAARKVYPGTPLGPYFVANGARMYTVEPTVNLPANTPPGGGVPDVATLQTMTRMIESFRFLTDGEAAAARAALPTAAPPRTPEQVADGVAAAFTAKDVDALAGFLSACVSTGAEQAGGVTVSREKYVCNLRAAFASGVVVTVQPRPLVSPPFAGPDDLVAAATWKDSRGSFERGLVLHRGENDRWYWSGTLERLSGDSRTSNLSTFTYPGC